MHLDHQPVGPDRHGRLGQRRDHERDARRVAGVNHNGQVGHGFQHRHGGQVQRVAHARLKGADAALAQHNVGVAFGHDVLGAHHQFLQRVGQPALEQHRRLQAAHGLQQLKVLHVARADLDHIHPGVHKQRDMLVVHQLGHDGLARRGAGGLQQFQPLGPQALETVGAGARLERAAAQNAGPGRLHPLCDAHDLVAPLHAARARHHGKVPAADLVPGHVHHRVVGVELAVGLFVRLADAAAGLHHRVGQHPALGQVLCVADQPQNVGVAADGIVDGKPHAAQLRAELLHLGDGGVLF